MGPKSTHLDTHTAASNTYDLRGLKIPGKSKLVRVATQPKSMTNIYVKLPGGHKEHPRH